MTKKQKTINEQIKDLVDLAQSLNLPNGAFDGELQDECDNDAELAFEHIKESSLKEQLTFLYEHGFQIGRLRELIEEMSHGQETQSN